MKKKTDDTIDRILVLKRVLNQNGISDEDILSVKIAAQMEKVGKAVKARLDAPFSGTLREAKEELDRLNMIMNSVMLLDALRIYLTVRKCVES